MAEANPQLTPQYLRRHIQNNCWPYLAGHDPSTEATAWCAIACRYESDLARQSLSYLLAAQNSDGGWSTQVGTEPSDWTSGLALASIQILEKTITADHLLSDNALLAKAKSAIDAGLLHLMRSRADFTTGLARIMLFLVGGLNYDYPRGWSWSPNTYNWIEPTAYAVLALKMNSKASEGRYKLALTEANAYFMKTDCHTGGWNYGCPASVGAFLPPQVVPTAWALMALHDAPAAKLQAALSILCNEDDIATQTLQAQALCILALHAHGFDVKERIKKLQGQFPHDEPAAQNLYIAALSTVATQVDTHGNPFIAPGIAPRADTAG